jgi:hypothetical protein
MMWIGITLAIAALGTAVWRIWQLRSYGGSAFRGARYNLLAVVAVSLMFLVPPLLEGVLTREATVWVGVAFASIGFILLLVGERESRRVDRSNSPPQMS